MNEPYSRYATVESSVSDGVTNQDMGLSAKPIRGERCIITSNAAITVRFNVNTNDAVSIAANGTLTVENLFIDEVFVTNASGGAAAVKIFIVGR